jgi:hypothetical protein
MISLVIFIHVLMIQLEKRENKEYCSYVDDRFSKLMQIPEETSYMNRFVMISSFAIDIHSKNLIAVFNFSLSFIMTFFVIFSFVVLLVMNVLSICAIIFVMIPFFIAYIAVNAVFTLLRTGFQFMKKMIRVADMQKVYRIGQGGFDSNQSCYVCLEKFEENQRVY